MSEMMLQTRPVWGAETEAEMGLCDCSAGGVCATVSKGEEDVPALLVLELIYVYPVKYEDSKIAPASLLYSARDFHRLCAADRILAELELPAPLHSAAKAKHLPAQSTVHS